MTSRGKKGPEVGSTPKGEGFCCSAVYVSGVCLCVCVCMSVCVCECVCVVWIRVCM